MPFRFRHGTAFAETEMEAGNMMFSLNLTDAEAQQLLMYVRSAEKSGSLYTEESCLRNLN